MSYESNTYDVSTGTLIAATLAGVAALSGGMMFRTDREPRAVEDLPAAERVAHDYTGLSAHTGIFGDSCLDGSPYDTYVPYANLHPETVNPRQPRPLKQGPAATVLVDPNKTIVVIPDNEYVPHLKLVDAGPDKPLQPQDAAAAAILQQYDCKIEYPQVTN